MESLVVSPHHLDALVAEKVRTEKEQSEEIIIGEHKTK